MGDTKSEAPADEADVEEWENAAPEPGSSWSRGERITGAVIGTFLTIVLYWGGVHPRVPAKSPKILGYTAGFLIVLAICVVIWVTLAHLLHYHRKAIGSATVRHGSAAGRWSWAGLGRLCKALAAWISESRHAGRDGLDPSADARDGRDGRDGPDGFILTCEEIVEAAHAAWGFRGEPFPIDVWKVAAPNRFGVRVPVSVVPTKAAEQSRVSELLADPLGVPVLVADARWLGVQGKKDLVGGWSGEGSTVMALLAPASVRTPTPAAPRATADAPAPAVNLNPDPSPQPAQPRGNPAVPTAMTDRLLTRLKERVPPEARPLLALFRDFTPDNDDELRQKMEGLAATLVCLGQEVADLHERCTEKSVGLDPKAMGYTNDAAEAIGECAGHVVKASVKFDQHYAGVSEEVSDGLQLPTKGGQDGFLTGGGARG